MRTRYWVIGTFTAILFFVLLTAFFWQSLIPKYILYTLEKSAHSMKGSFQSEGIFKEGDRWVISKPTFYTPSLTLHADAFFVTLDLQFFKRKLALNLHVEKPIIDIFELQKDWNRWLEFEPIGLGFLKLRGHVTVKDGELAVHYPSNKTEKIFFQMEVEHKHKTRGECLLSFNPAEKEDRAEIHFFRDDQQGNEYTFHFTQFDCSKSFLIFGQFFVSARNILITEGILNGSLRLLKSNKKSSTPISIEGDLSLNHFTFYDPFLFLQGKINDGTLRIDSTGNGKAAFSGVGEILQEKNPPILIEKVLGEITFHPEILPILKIKGELLGLWTQVEVDWGTPEKFVKGCLEGPANRLAALMAYCHPSILPLFGHEKFRLDGHLEISKEGQQKILGHLDNTAFHCDFQLFSFETAKNIYEVVRQGAFQTSSLSLEHIGLPLIMGDKSSKINGKVDVDGKWKDSILQFTYKMKDFLWENTDFLLQTASTEKGEHQIDLTTFQYTGHLHVKEGSYLEKNTGLEFTDIDARVQLSEKKIEIPQVEAFCQGVFIGGNMEIDFQKEISNSIHIHTLNGTLSQLKNILSFINIRSFFNQFPLEGSLSLRHEGATIQFGSTPDTFQAAVYGSLTDGFIRSPFDVSAQEVAFQFDYDYGLDRLNIFDLQGVVLVGKPNKVEEYLLASDRIYFSHYTKNEAEFDIWLGDKNRDILRLAGQTRKTTNAKRMTGLIEVTLNHDLSHFGDVHPETFQLVLKNWSEIHAFKMDFNFRLHSLLSDIQRFSHTGFLFLSRRFIKKLDELKDAQGSFTASFLLEPPSTSLNYLVKGEGVILDGQPIKQVLLKGKKKNNVWTVDQFTFDKISFSAELRRLDFGWKVDFLGLSIGDSLLLGMDGEYVDLDKQFKGRINLLELYLDGLDEWKWGKRMNSYLNLKGVMRGNGEIALKLENDAKLNIDSLLNLSGKGVEINGWEIDDIQKVSCRYQTDQGIAFDHIHGSVSLNDNEKRSVSIAIERLSYDVKTEAFDIKGLHFACSPSALKWLSSYIDKTYPRSFHPSVPNLLAKLKQHENLEGDLDLTIANPFFGLHLAFKDGVYILGDHTHEIKDLIFDYDPYSLEMRTHYRFHNTYYWIRGHAVNPLLEEGEWTIVEALESPAKEHDVPLSIQWKKDGSHHLCPEKIFGMIGGIECDLRSDSKSTLDPNLHTMSGSLRIHSPGLISWLYPDLPTQSLTWKMKDGLHVKGKWTFSKSFAKNDPPILFQGSMLSSSFELQGFHVDQLEAEGVFTQKKMTLNTLIVHDRAGKLSAKEITLLKDDVNDLWSIELPSLNITDFRPHLFEDPFHYFSKASKNLTIRQLELSHVKGFLQKISSFKGNGRLSFSNPAKDNISNQLFDIPEDKLSKIGLNLSLLTPVTGTIYFDLENGTLFFKKFRDVFSEGKVSKFYLAESGQPSFLDNEGNFYMEIAMKQYNLLFKLAELFNLTIKGKFNNLDYSVQKNESKK